MSSAENDVASADQIDPGGTPDPRRRVLPSDPGRPRWTRPVWRRNSASAATDRLTLGANLRVQHLKSTSFAAQICKFSGSV